MHSFLVFILKDLRLLWRDRAALMFILVAPLIVISVAGFSLANLYGGDPSGQTAYDLPIVDEDGSALARQIRDRLDHEPAVRVRDMARREEAEALVRDEQVGTALVIPRGTEAALVSGQEAKLILYNDPVRYLERINLRTRMLELGDAIGAQRRADAMQTAAVQRGRMVEQMETLKTTLGALHAKLEAAWRSAQAARLQAVENGRRAAAAMRGAAARKIERELQQQAAELQSSVQRQVDKLRADFRTYADALAAARNELGTWLTELKRLAGNHAADIPAPPRFPELPRELQEIVDGTRAPLQVALPQLALELPEMERADLPVLPELPSFEIPPIDLPEVPAAPSQLDIEEVNLSGGPIHINTFDQNVPGFAVTFLMLGMLLGISLGLLDEREWGTFDRMRALPVGPSQFVLAKLVSRFLVGVVQMILLLAAGWLAFGVSLGPQPAALLLPIAGIAFAGTSFGLVVASVATSREAVFSLGSVVMVTMAAVGGCWWPIDLEPRWMRTVAQAFPTTWAMDAFNDLMIRRRGIEAAYLPTAVMCAYGALYLAIGQAIFRRRLRS